MKNIRSEVILTNIWNQVWDQVLIQVGSQVRYRIWNQVDNQVRYQFFRTNVKTLVVNRVVFQANGVSDLVSN